VTAHDDELLDFEANGAPPLPRADSSGHVEHDGARIWYASYGTGAPVILLHGGLGHAGNWSKQLAALRDAGRRAVFIDSRGHGRSTRDSKPYSYARMADDVLAVMDHLGVGRAAFVGWSDGAVVALDLARRHPTRAAGVLFFACNVDPSGTKTLDQTNPLLGRCFRRHMKDYAQLSATPNDFGSFADAVIAMQQSQPNYSSADLAAIAVPVTIVQSERDEFIERAHAEYLAATIPGARFVFLPGVSHFAPLQRPDEFDRAVLEFLRTIERPST
jgi:pimeloyl-ACP methyl ester carboxylesterase